MKKALVVGASGATGKLLVADLLERGFEVTAIVRTSSSLKSNFASNTNYHEVSASITEMSDSELSKILEGCDAVLSCLGHTLNFRGMFAEPRRLVTDTVAKICRVIEALQPDQKVNVILMNTTGNAIFNSAASSRINVANLMANLATDPELWNRWRGKMPVIYNSV